MSRLLVLGSVIAVLVSLSYSWASGISDAWAEDTNTSIKAGETKAPFCARCHGADGISTNPGIPHLAGQQKEYFIKQLKDFRSGFRRSAPMREVTRTLSNSDIANLAAYYNSLPAGKP